MNIGLKDAATSSSAADWTWILFEVLDDIVLVHDPSGHIVEANAAAGRMLGFGHEELLRRNVRDLDCPQLQTAEPAMRFEGRLRGQHGQIISADVSTFAVEVRGQPAILSLARDLTQRRATEKALSDSEALYHSLVESLPQYIFRKDLAGRFTFGNQRYCRTHSLTPRQLLGKTDFDLFPVELARKYVNDDREVIRAGTIFEAVEEHRLPDGTQIFVQVVKTPVHDAQGNTIGIQGIFWDVTDKQRAALALADSECRYRQLAEATLDGIIVVDQDELIRLFNPAAERMFGYQAGEVLGRPVSTLIPENHLDHRLDFKRLLELKARRKDGSEFAVEVALSVFSAGVPVGPDGREALQFLGALRDLTERNKIRSALVQNEKLASIGMLSAGVAHEINNPLAFVANNVAVLERDCRGLLNVVRKFESLQTKWTAESLPAPLAEELAQLQDLADAIDLPYIQENLMRILDRTREGVDRVTRIVHSLRGLARTGPPRRQEANLADLAANSLEIMRNRLKKNFIEVEQIHDPHPMVFGVVTQLSQVILNLLINAVQAIVGSEEPGAYVGDAAEHRLQAARREGGRIVIRTRRFVSEMLLEVSDNGCGIPAGDVPRLFDPFFTTKEVGEGTGLGLSITHNIVAAHGGRIEVDSKPGEGSTFRVFLPVRGRPR